MGLHHCSQVPHTSAAKIRFPRRAFRLSIARGEITELSTPRPSRRRLVATLSQGLPRFAPILFSVDRIRREDYRIIGENRDGCFAKSFFAGKFGVSIFCSNE